jgi:hypothetical protein
MKPSENNPVVEIHGCIVCGRLFNILAVYSPAGKLLECTVTSPGGHCLIIDAKPLAACDDHPPEQIETAYKKWKSRNEDEADNELDE